MNTHIKKMALCVYPYQCVCSIDIFSILVIRIVNTDNDCVCAYSAVVQYVNHVSVSLCVCVRNPYACMDVVVVQGVCYVCDWITFQECSSAY